MKQNYFNHHLRRTLMAAAIAAPGLLFAGNIPQYQVSKDGSKYSEITGGVKIPCSYTGGEYAILPNGSTTPNVRTTEGFPIGFDFKFAGQIVNQFIPSNLGDIYLGRDVVTYGNKCFHISMTPMKDGLKAGDISYKVSGDDGDRILTIQWKNATLDQSSGYIGQYNLQFRLYERNGKIEMAFKELETPQHSNGFETGIHGWNTRDAILLTSSGLNSDVSVSSSYSADILNSSSFITWDASDYDRGYSPCFVFTPESEMLAPTASPQDLKVEQHESTLHITAQKGADAGATVVMISEQPFTDADFPINGETFNAGASYKIGNATALYYVNHKDISVVAKNIEAGKIYYICAFSVSGYPIYAIDNRAETIFSTTQAAPNSLIVASSGKSSLEITCEADYPIVVAAINECKPGYQQGYVGNFGQIEGDVAVGVELNGGGKIVYVGDGGSFNLDCNGNELTFLRAWTIKDGKLSATCLDAYGISMVSYPYEPNLENYPLAENLKIWEASEDQYIPFTKEYDNTKALRAVSVNSNNVKLTSPMLELDKPIKVSFEYSMETVKPADAQGVPQGNRPGDFGAGSMSIQIGSNSYKTISTYYGTMTECPDGYETGSSTYELVEVEIDDIEEEGQLSIVFNTSETSYLYLRNLIITQTEEVPKAPESVPTDATADEDKSANLYFSCKKGDDAEYTLVLFSEKPITDFDYPQDGVIPAVGSPSGNATVLYYGNDENVECVTNYDIVIADYNTTYYFAALSASANPLYNRENLAKVEYTTMKEAGNAVFGVPFFNEENMTMTVNATRHVDAASTLILLSEGKFNGTLEDGRKYENGEFVGNATVLFHDSHEAIEHTTNKIEPNKTYTLTAISANERGWWSDLYATTTFNTITGGIESVEAIDANMEIYNVVGLRIKVNSLEELPRGVYVINGKKRIIK